MLMLLQIDPQDRYGDSLHLYYEDVANMKLINPFSTGKTSFFLVYDLTPVVENYPQSMQII